MKILTYSAGLSRCKKAIGSYYRRQLKCQAPIDQYTYYSLLTN